MALLVGQQDPSYRVFQESLILVSLSLSLILSLSLSLSSAPQADPSSSGAKVAHLLASRTLHTGCFKKV